MAGRCQVNCRLRDGGSARPSRCGRLEAPVENRSAPTAPGTDAGPGTRFRWQPGAPGPLPRRLAPMFAALAVVSGTARALSEGELLGDLPVVFSVARMPQPQQEAPGMVTVLDRETIRASGYRNLPDLLRLAPGFQVAWLRGWWGVATYHGLAGEFSNRVLVLVDGRPVNSEYWSQGVDWQSLPVAIDDVERIEILGGSNSATHGTNAFLGVVNIATRAPGDSPGTSVRATAGSGEGETVLRWSGGNGALAARITVGWRGGEGLDFLRDTWRSRLVNLRAEARPSASDELSVAFAHQAGKAFEGYATDPFNPIRERRSANQVLQLDWLHTLSGGAEARFSFYESADRHADELTLPLLPGPVEVNTNRTALRRSLEGKLSGFLTDDLRGNAGVELRTDALTSLMLFGNPDARRSHTWRLFGNLEWRALRATTLNLGLMAERVSLTRGTLAPRLFINHEVASGHMLRAGLSAATRSPNIFEARFNQRATPSGIPIDQLIIGNPGLKPERIAAAELGYQGRIAAGNSQWNLRLYEERLKDLIVQVPYNDSTVPPGAQAFTFENLETSRNRGLEGQFAFSPRPGTRLTLTHAIQRIRQHIPRVAGSAPRNATSVMWTQSLSEAIDFSLVHHQVGRIQWLEFGDDIGAYRRTDARATWRWRDGPYRGELIVAGTNLFGRYNEFRAPPPPETHAFGRRYTVGIKLDF